MAVYQLTSPKGEKFKVTAPDTATPEQVMSYFQQNAGHPDLSVARPEDLSVGDIAKRGLNVAATYYDARTMGAGPKIASGIGATLSYPAVAAIKALKGEEIPSLSDQYKQGVDMYSAPGKQAFQDTPAAATLASLAGGVKLGGEVMGSKVGKGVAAQLAEASRPVKFAAQAALGDAAYRGYKAAAAPVGQEGAAFTAPVDLGDVLSVGIPAVTQAGGAAISAVKNKMGAAAKLSEAGKQASKELDSTAGQSYDTAAYFKEKFSPVQVGNQLDKTIKELHPKPLPSGKTTTEDVTLQNALKEFEGNTGKSLSLEDIAKLDTSLSKKITAAFIDARTGLPDANGRVLMQLQSRMRAIVDAVPNNSGNAALVNGRNFWAAKMRINDLEAAAERASLALGDKGNALKTAYKQLYLDKDRIRGWPPEAVALLKKAAEPSFASELLSPLTSKLTAILMGGQGNLAGAATAHIVGMAGRGAKESATAARGALVQQSLVDNALKAERNVVVPPPDYTPRQLAAPGKLSALPMTDKQVSISQQLMNRTPPKVSTGEPKIDQPHGIPVAPVNIAERLRARAAGAVRSKAAILADKTKLVYGNPEGKYPDPAYPNTFRGLMLPSYYEQEIAHFKKMINTNDYTQFGDMTGKSKAQLKVAAEAHIKKLQQNLEDAQRPLDPKELLALEDPRRSNETIFAGDPQGHFQDVADNALWDIPGFETYMDNGMGINDPTPFEAVAQFLKDAHTPSIYTLKRETKITDTKILKQLQQNIKAALSKSPSEGGVGVPQLKIPKSDVYWHGGAPLSSANTGVTYFSKNKELAASYLSNEDNGYSTKNKLQAVNLTATKFAPIEKVLAEAKKLGVVPDESAGEFALHLFDSNYWPQGFVKKLVTALKKQGYEGATGKDFSYDGQIHDDAHVIFDSKHIKPIKGK